LEKGRTKSRAIAACEQWLEAWALVKQMATPEMRTARAFDQAYPNLQQSIYNWSSHLDMELHNAGLDDPHYCEHRLRYAREYLAQFLDEDDDSYVNLKRAEGESLWQLGQQAEAEAVYQTLVDKLPDKAWGYIGWADHYIWGQHEQPVDYEQAETILLQALKRPNLDEPTDVVYRLRDLYKVWEDGPKKPPQPVIDFIERLQEEKVRLNAELAELKQEQQQLQAELVTSKPKKFKRNEPCWCGSGKKYKYCHMRSDKRGK
jgi:tetratricopeptide (TPR) repeat protein